MSNLVTFSDKDQQLIRDTVAKGATPTEFQLFIHRCQNMGLDPLKPGQVHFVKYGSAPGTMIVGIDGFRTRAARTGKHSGTERGLVRDKEGKCIGAWCQVYRNDWDHPAREEVSLSEYNTGKSMWAKMPETMIKKVAEVAALRMAFPDELGGLYSNEEMDQAEPIEVEVKPRYAAPKAVIPSTNNPTRTQVVERDPRSVPMSGSKKYREKYKTVGDAVDGEGLPSLMNYVDWFFSSNNVPMIDPLVMDRFLKKMHPETEAVIRAILDLHEEAKGKMTDELDIALNRDMNAAMDRDIDEAKASRYNLPEEHLKS